MIKFFCDYCDAEISGEIIAARHLSDTRIRNQRNYCNLDHEVAHRTATGFYKDMSTKGRDARSKAVSQSNREKPRRKSKDSPIFA